MVLPAYLGRRLVRPDTKTRRFLPLEIRDSQPRSPIDSHVYAIATRGKEMLIRRREHVEPKGNHSSSSKRVRDERFVRPSERRRPQPRDGFARRLIYTSPNSLVVPDLHAVFDRYSVSPSSRNFGETRDTGVVLRKTRVGEDRPGSCSGSESKASEALLRAVAVSGAARRPLFLSLRALSYPGESIAVRKEDRADL